MSENNKSSYNERLKSFRQAQAAHKPKNRSSKHLRILNMKPIVRCVSRETLQSWSANGMFEASVELERRNKRAEKREANPSSAAQ